MKRLFGFLFFIVGGFSLIAIYLVKADMISKSSVSFMNFAFQSHTNMVISFTAFLILLLIGLLMIGRVGLGIISLLVGISGMIFPILTKYNIVAVPSGKFFQVLLKSNFYITIVISFVIFAFGVFLLSLKKKKRFIS